MTNEGTIISPDTLREVRVPPGQHLTDKWPVLHYGSVPKIDVAKWTLKISGLVDKEVTLNYREFTALKHSQVYADIHCVTTWSRLDNTWEGVSTTELKKLVEVSPRARHVMIYGSPSFSTNLPIDEFFETDVLLAVKHNDLPISAEHGAPVRLVVPRLYFWKSAKWVSRIEFVESDKRGFWEWAGYHNHGDPWKEERYSR